MFYRSEKQRIFAEESKERVASEIGKVETEIIPVKEFTYAEGYHQKYYLTQFRELRAFLEANYPDTKSLADSTVAARLNAALFSGFGDPRRIVEEEIDRYDLPDDLRQSVLNRL